MIYKYGTSGFRYKSKILIGIANKIGKYLAYYGSNQNKFIGIIITASHNPSCDNGVKIINSNGFLLMNDEEKECTDFINNKLEDPLILGKYIPKILIANDTRRSGALIKRLVIGGIKSIIDNAIIEDLDYLSTPQMHYELVSINQKIKILYEDYYLKHIDLKQDIIVDCSNGIGTKVLEDLEYHNLINTKVDDYNLLNNNCGSDYICINQCLPKFYDSYFSNNKLYASLDGDADRCIFFYKDNTFKLLNGDAISALYCLFLQKFSNLDITFIHTSYTNHGLIDYLKNINIKCVCVKTGVKHLQNESLKHDLSVYFESNGHGSIHYKQNIYQNSCQEIKNLLKTQSQYTGDGVSHIYAVDYILTSLNLTKEDWYNLYENNESKLYQLIVKDRSIYKCDKNETQLIEPIIVKEKLDKLMKEYSCYIFVRPSGTEDIIRVYIENLGENQENNLGEIFEIIKNIIV